MSAASGQSSAAPSLRRLPFTVSIAPSFANSFISLDAEVKAESAGCGLLFGILDNGSVLVKRSCPFDLFAKRGEGWLDAGVMVAQLEDDFKALSPVGWYIQRPTGGLLESDIGHHNRHFSKPTDLAMVIRPEGSNEIVIEIYSRSAEGLLSEEAHRWGLLRLTKHKLLEAPAVVTMRSQLRDEFFLHAYNQPYETRAEAAPAIWKRAINRLRRAPESVAGGSSKAKEPHVAVPSGEEHRIPSGAGPRPAAGSQPASLASTGNLDFAISKKGPDTAPEPAVAQKPPDTAPNKREISTDLAASGESVVRSSSKDQSPIPPAEKSQLAYDPANDVTIEMPRELAFKALGLDIANGSSDTAKPPVIVKSALLATPEKELVPLQELPPLTAGHPKPAASRRRTSLWISAAALFGIAAAATFAVIQYRILPDSFISAPGPSSPLGLKVEGQGERILVTWNRKSDAALKAARGQLAIEDGPQHKVLTLDSAQILTGSVLYRPNSADISFRLQMTDGAGKQRDETLRVLDASRTNNDGIKVISVDDAPTPLPSSATKPPALRKNIARIPPPESAVVPPEATLNQTSNGLPGGSAPQSELPPPMPQQQKETPLVAEPEKPAPPSSAAAPPNDKGISTVVGAARESVAPQKSSDEASETVLPAPSASPKQNPPQTTPPAVIANPLRNYNAPKPTRQVVPNLRALPPGLAAANAQIEVTVSLDAQGRVLAARVTNTTGKASSALSNAAIMAARGWTFSPATMNGRPVPSEHAIVFNFKPSSR